MKKYKNIWLLIVSIFFIWLILTLIDNTRIQVTNYNITSKKLDDHIVIAQVSDLHNTTFGKNNHRLIKAIKKSKPDIITITGDLIDSSKPNINIAINFIKQAVKIAPTYYVPGNHEAWNLANYSNESIRNENSQYLSKIINNVEIEVSALVEHTKYDHYIINSLKRRIITLTDMNVIVDDRPTMLVNLLRELHEEYDTSEFLDENPIIHEIIFNYS